MSYYKTQDFLVGKEFNLDSFSNIGFSRPGYHFKEWNTERDGSGQKYTDGQVMNLTDDLVLYAIWEQD